MAHLIGGDCFAENGATSFVSEWPWTTRNPMMNPSKFLIDYDQISKGMC
jgi:hypothetical protein